jgi:hypothetical protein
MRGVSSTTRPSSRRSSKPTVRLRVRSSWWASPTVFAFMVDVVVVVALAVTELVLAVKDRHREPTPVG